MNRRTGVRSDSLSAWPGVRVARHPVITAAVAVGAALGLGVTASRAASVYVAGANQYGQLGNGTTGNGGTTNTAAAFVPVTDMATGASAVAAGGAHSLAVRNGALYAWGLYTYGQTGDGTGDGSAVGGYTTPHPAIVLTSGVTAVEGGLYHSMALANGGVYTFGFNTDGQLANGTPVGNLTAVPTLVTDPSLASGVSAIASGQRHVVALKNGSVYAWGYNVYGQIGTGASGPGTPGVTAPYQVPSMTGGVTAIAAGGVHTLAIKDGAAYGWGSNQYGQVGNNGPTGAAVDAFINTPQAVVGLTSGVTDVSGGGFFSLALKDGAVYAWGRNESGQLGQGNFSNSPVPLPVSGISGLIIDVEAGSSSSYALAADGSLWTWGSNKYGQLGLGSTENEIYETPQHVLPPTGYTFTGLDAGSSATHVLALLNKVGDFNRDDVINAADIDLLFGATAGPLSVANARFDVTGDGSVVTKSNVAGSDADYWVRTIERTAYGDANLDTKVNFADLLTLAKHYGAAGGWADGNFDGVPGVTFSDLLLLAKNYGFGGTGAVSAEAFAADWSLAQSLVPEPGSLLLIASALVPIRRRRRA